MKMCKSLLFATMVALVMSMAVQAQAYTSTFFGEDLYPGGSVAGAVNSQAAADSFYSHLTNVGVEDFESFSNGDSAPIVADFGAAGTATITGDGSIYGPSGAGRFATSGTHYWEVSTESGFTLTFSDPVAAFGFWGTDIGDFLGQLIVTLSNGTSYNVPHTINAPNGSALFWGIIDTDSLFSSVSFTKDQGAASSDYFGFDDFTIGSETQVVPEPGSVPEPSTFILLGLSLAGLMTFRKRLMK